MLASGAVSAATIPVADDVGAGRRTGYAIASVAGHSATVSAKAISADDGSITLLGEIPLEPGQQQAAFLFQAPKASQKFRDSVILSGKEGSTFALVALVVSRIQKLTTETQRTPRT